MVILYIGTFYERARQNEDHTQLVAVAWTCHYFVIIMIIINDCI